MDLGMHSSVVSIFGEDVTDFLKLASVEAHSWPDIRIVILLHIPSGMHWSLEDKFVNNIEDFKREVGKFLDRCLLARDVEAL